MAMNGRRFKVFAGYSLDLALYSVSPRRYAVRNRYRIYRRDRKGDYYGFCPRVSKV